MKHQLEILWTHALTVKQVIMKSLIVKVQSSDEVSFITIIRILGKSCHALAEIILREKTRKEFDSNYESLPILNELMSKMNMKNLLMQSCQMRNWDACNMYAVLAFEGQHGVQQDPELGIALAEKSCTIGRDVKACNNLIRIYKEGLFGRNVDEEKAASYQSIIDSFMDEREAFMMNK